MAQDWARLYEEARGLHRAGRLDDARQRYMDVIAANPSHGGAMHMLGLVAWQIGRADTATDLLRQAAVLDPLVPAVHANLGLVLKARGRMKDAEASLRRALTLSPQAETQAALGQLLLEQNRLAEAAESFRAALARQPGLAEAQAGLGECLWKLGRAGEAQAHYEKAAALAPSSETLANLALLLFARGEAGAALARIRQALALEESPRAKAVFAAMLRGTRWERDDPQMRPLLERALREGWARPSLLLPPAADLVKLRLAAGGGFESDTLLQQVLVAGPNCDLELEAALTAARRQLLARPENRDLAFTAALAQQCFINEYVFAEEDGERAEAEALAARLEEALAADDVVPALPLLAVACYRPLFTLKGAEGLLRRAWPEPLEAVLRQQVAEPAEERRLAAQLPALTPVDDGVSAAVRAQYEENPYPRWVQMEAGEAPQPLSDYLSRRFPAFDGARLPALPRMLFAGCGTGRFTLELARRHPAESRLAIDLSRASLAYAARKAAEAGIALDFAQADILRLPQTGRRFAVIESSGVLHHIAEPFAGWKALLDCLESGGVMRVALYSRLARAPLAEIRAWMAGEGVAATAEGIRAARQRLIAERPAEAQLLRDTADFYSLSAFRDLLLPVAEHGLALAEIGGFLKENGLVFLGFEMGEDMAGAYRARFPDDPAATDLDHWAAFEAEHPALFAAMYQFWVQKP